MADQRQNKPLLPLTKLWEKQSGRGNSYLAGRLGGARILVMRNASWEKEGDATHVLLLGEADDNRSSGNGGGR